MSRHQALPIRPRRVPNPPRRRRSPQLPATETVDVWPGDDERARDEAVADVRAVLESGWRRWATDAGLDPVPALQCREPRVTVVGEQPEHYRLVGLIRFTFTAEGIEFRGCARGPLEAPYFAVQRALRSDAPSATTRRRRWWRHA